MSIENMKRPVRITRAMHYMDGGTVSAELTDALGRLQFFGFDGRLQGGQCTYPAHCFVGAPHPLQPGVRMLPLWGKEERAMISLARHAIEATISPVGRTLQVVPRGLDESVWKFVRVTERRYEAIEALDHGQIASLKAVLTYFEARTPLTITGIHADQEGRNIHMTVRDPGRKSFQLGLRDSGSSVASKGYRLNFAPGCDEDRLVLALVEIALKGTPSQTGQRGDEKRALSKLLERRKSQILRNDQAR